jgi:PAS domain S-box-containing protein
MEGIFGSEEKYRRMVETAMKGYGSLPSRPTLFVNQKWRNMLGYTREDMIGKTGLGFMEIGRKVKRQSAKEDCHRLPAYIEEFSSTAKTEE